MSDDLHGLSPREASRRMLLAGAPVGLLAALAGGAANARTAGSPMPEDLAVASGATGRIDVDTLVSGNLILEHGARLLVARGATLTLLGDLVAPLGHIFHGEGSVDLLRSRVLAARPEWWGARAGDAAVDCRTALAACLAAHPVTLLGAGDYHIAGTWTIDRPNRRIWGIGRTKDAGGTRILLARDGSGAVVLVGTAAAPPSINDYLRGVDLRWIELGRTAAPVPGGDVAVGLSIAHVLDCRFEGLRANEHAVGYAIRGAVRTYLHDCCAFRSVARDLAGRDTFVGFDMDGTAPPIATGANASLYLIDCNASLGGAPRLAEAVGARLTGAMSDTFIVRFETSAVATGIELDGGAQATGRFSQVDVHIDTPVLDQCSQVGVSVTGLGPTAMVELVSPYVSVAPGGRAAIAIARSGGSVRIGGGQLIGSLAPGAIGVLLDGVGGATVEGAALLGFTRPVVARDAHAFDLAFLCLADSAGHGPVVTLDRCRQGHLRPRLTGAARAHAPGIAIDRSSRGLSIETIGLDPAALADSRAAVTIDGRLALSGATSVVTIASAP